MRIAFISDIHGNLTALNAVLADIRQTGVDQIVCLGDTISLGAQPLETLHTLRSLNCTYLMGNHDEAILTPERAPAFEISENVIPDLHWCRNLLKPEDLDFIKTFANTHELTLPNGMRVLAFHGSPHSCTDMILSTTPPEDLERFFAGQTAPVCIGGHTHIQMLRRHGRQNIINSGSVGNAFEFAYTPGNPPRLIPCAEYAILEQSGPSLKIDLRHVEYDQNALLQAVKESGLPNAGWWVKQF